MIWAQFTKKIKEVVFSNRHCQETITKPVRIVRTMSTPSHINFFEEEEEDLRVIEEWLMKYSGGTVHLTQDNESGIAKITLDQPAKLNAMSGKMMVEFGSAVQQLEKWPEGKGVIVCGSGKMLCSGGDLDFARAVGNAKGGYRMATYMHNVLGRLRSLPLVSVAVVHGQGAIGGGAEMTCWCDFRLITKDCRGICFVHTRMGIVPAWGGTTRLVKLLGEKRALDAILTSRIFKPSEALEIGLIDHVIETVSDAEDWLRTKTRASVEVVQAAKLTVVGCQERLDNEKRALEFERRLFCPLWGGPANLEALKSQVRIYNLEYK